MPTAIVDESPRMLSSPLAEMELAQRSVWKERDHAQGRIHDGSCFPVDPGR